MSHPTFKALAVVSNIRSHPHMLQPRITKMIPAKDSWHPCFDEKKDTDRSFISGNVEVSIMPWVIGTFYQKQTYVEKWCWRIVIWGADDTYVAQVFDTLEDARAVYEALDSCPARDTVTALWGFSFD